MCVARNLIEHKLQILMTIANLEYMVTLTGDQISHLVLFLLFSKDLEDKL